jgi:adenylate cyclase
MHVVGMSRTSNAFTKTHLFATLTCCNSSRSPQAIRYVSEGSIRRAGGRVRIAAQLIDATTGGHVWAERFEDRDTDLFELQDRITEHVVGALEPRLQNAEIARATAKPTESLDAYDLYLRGLQQFHLM